MLQEVREQRAAGEWKATYYRSGERAAYYRSGERAACYSSGGKATCYRSGESQRVTGGDRAAYYRRWESSAPLELVGKAAVLHQIPSLICHCRLGNDWYKVHSRRNLDNSKWDLVLQEVGKPHVT
jgi:hypothetical protein